MFDTETFAAIISLPGETEIEPAALLAVAEVESGGRALFDINGKKIPAIRFEGHYFDRRLSGRIRDQAHQAGLSAYEAVCVRNPKTERERAAALGGQIQLMLRFIEKAGLKEALQKRDWRNFSRRYNGPAFARNQYDCRIAAAFGR
ncbi:N-acetylmuramidase domain-containing protein [Ochrobactrum quorumnocens]|uniref:N-acetylmuramidase domain-containing protein n=1 Tax=Ochrobactrum quorumnocens TaxID=271865 RepID=UPI003852BD51